MTEFSVGDRVLVPGVVKHVYPNSVVLVRQWGAENEFFDVDLRPDTGGRDLTAEDIRDAIPDGKASEVADRLNRIARGDAGSAGDDIAPPAGHFAAPPPGVYGANTGARGFAPRATTGPQAGAAVPTGVWDEDLDEGRGGWVMAADTVPRAPVEALLAALGNAAARIPYGDPVWQQITDARDDVRRFLNEEQ